MSMPMQKLVRPAQYKRPDFAAAYAKAVFRYKIDVGIFPTFALRSSKVVRVLSVDDIEDGTKAPAVSIGGDSEYVVPVTIGTPGVELHLDFDTGSSDLWIFSTELTAAQDLQDHRFYDSKKSSTAHKDPISSWEIHFGDESWAKGDVWNDTVTIGDIAIKGQAIELATEVEKSFLVDGGNDGLLGLGFGSINEVRPRPVHTPMENMISQHLLAKPVFSCKLGRGEGSAGYYSFGYIDPESSSEALSYTPVDSSKGYWKVPSTSYTINGRKTDRPGNTCILDTGTTLSLVDDTVLSHIYGAIHGAVFSHEGGGWIYPVNARMPEVSFAIGDKLYKINPKDMAYGEAFDGYYFGGFQSRGNKHFDILGDAFLKSVYVVFDQGNKTVGLAQRND